MYCSGSFLILLSMKLLRKTSCSAFNSRSVLPILCKVFAVWKGKLSGCGGGLVIAANYWRICGAKWPHSSGAGGGFWKINMYVLILSIGLNCYIFAIPSNVPQLVPHSSHSLPSL